MSNSNRWNLIGHIALGIAAELIPGLHYYAAKREIDQCPMENDMYPELTAWLDGWGLMTAAEFPTKQVGFKPGRTIAYWAAPRVLDSLNDTREIAIGKEIGRWVAWGLMVGVGAWLF